MISMRTKDCVTCPTLTQINILTRTSLYKIFRNMYNSNVVKIGGGECDLSCFSSSFLPQYGWD